jgi:Winged helix DNA-binding domain
MRGTLHLVAADDFGWLVGLTVEPHVANSHRRLREMGVGPDHMDRGVRAIERMLDREGPMTRAEIGERLRRRGLPTEGQILPHLTWLAAAGGKVCIGPDRDGQRSYVLVRDWLRTPAAGDRDRALAELAVRYLRAHGPATPGDLAAWSGIRAGDATRGWRSIQGRLVEVDGPYGPMWDLKSRGPEEVPAGLVRLLPSFDEFLLGWKDRRFLADAATWRLIMPGGGWFHPAVVAGGRPVGTWALDRRTADTRAEIRPFSRPTPAVRRGVAAEIRSLATFLRTDIDATFARPA